MARYTGEPSPIRQTIIVLAVIGIGGLVLLYLGGFFSG